MKNPLKTKIFYGWWMVAAAFGLQFMQASLLSQSIGAYIAVLREEFGWSKTALSGAAVIQQLEGALLGPIQGWFVDRFGPRGMICVGVFTFGTGFMLLSRVDSLPMFYAAFAVVALGAGLGGYFPLTIAMVNWFERKRARALSSMTLGFALGGMAVPIVAWSLQTFGWRATVFASGVLIIVAGLPLAMVIRRRPEDQGEVVDGLREPQADRAASPRGGAHGARDFTAREALRTPAFWLLALFTLLVYPVQAGISLHQAPFLIERGLDATVAATAVSTFALLSAVAGFAYGFWPRRVPQRFALALVGATVGASCVLMQNVQAAPLAYGAAALFGLGIGSMVRSPPIPSPKSAAAP